MNSALRNSRSKDIRVFAIIIAEGKFCNIQRQILAADLVEAPHDAALQQRPEALDSVGVDRADNVTTSAVIDDAMREVFSELSIGIVIVGAKQAYFGRDGFAHEFIYSGHVCAKNNA